MNNRLSNPVICIDLKKNRIRIHKITLRQMGNPEYIQLLVNPAAQSMIIRGCAAGDKFCQKVRMQHLNSDYCYELYSTELLNSMKSVASGWEDKHSDRIYGSYNRVLDAALFILRDFEII